MAEDGAQEEEVDVSDLFAPEDGDSTGVVLWPGTSFICDRAKVHRSRRTLLHAQQVAVVWLNLSLYRHSKVARHSWSSVPAKAQQAY